MNPFVQQDHDADEGKEEELPLPSQQRGFPPILVQLWLARPRRCYLHPIVWSIEVVHLLKWHLLLDQSVCGLWLCLLGLVLALWCVACVGEGCT